MFLSIRVHSMSRVVCVHIRYSMCALVLVRSTPSARNSELLVLKTGSKMVLGITRGLGILGCLGSFTLECHVSCGMQLGQDLRVQFLNRIHSSTHTAYGYQRRFIPERVEPLPLVFFTSSRHASG